MLNLSQKDKDCELLTSLGRTNEQTSEFLDLLAEPVRTVVNPPVQLELGYERQGKGDGGLCAWLGIFLVLSNCR